jgi:hypothetical protein
MAYSTPIYDLEDNASIWKIILMNMNIHRITPRQLAQRTEYSIFFIFKGVKGETALITDEFLRKCVEVFGSANGRIDPYNPINPSSHLTRQECIDVLRPPSAMPTGEKNFWENDN